MRPVSGELFNLALVTMVRRIISPQDHFFGHGGFFDYIRTDIFRDIDEYRARSAGTGDIERFLYYPPEICSILDKVVVFGDRHRYAGDVGFLEGVVTQKVCRDLSGQCDYRHRIHIGRCDTGYEVTCAGARGCEADSNTTARTCVPVRGMRCCLLMPYKDVLQ